MKEFNKLQIIRYPNKLLKKKSEPILNLASLPLDQICQGMKEILRSHEGVGLAGPQVGILKRIILVEIEKDKPIFLINPVITYFSKKKVYGIEGCLSIPKVFGTVLRPQKIKVEALDIDGNKISLKARGIGARVIQHEVDHLEGILFIEKAEHIAQGKEQLEKANKIES